MTFEAALIIGVFILVATAIGIGSFAASRRQRAKDEELQRAASARGWKFESKTQRGYRIQRWTGSTDGVSWEAESLDQTSGDEKEQRRHIARWHGVWSPGINGPIVVMDVPKGKEELGKTLAAGEGFLARLAQKAVGFAFDKAIDIYFGDGSGKEVDAGAMHRIDSKIPGYAVMAADKGEGARILQEGLESALRTGIRDQSSPLSDKHRPWILLRPHAVSLARMRSFRDLNELDRFVRAGVALTRQFRFGQRSSLN